MEFISDLKNYLANVPLELMIGIILVLAGILMLAVFIGLLAERRRPGPDPAGSCFDGGTLASSASDCWGFC